MKISAIIVSRNDNYGGHLNERATYCFNSAIDTYDEVIYVDWNSPTQSLLEEIKPLLKFKGNLVHVPVNKSDIEKLNPELLTIPIVDVLGRNIGIRQGKEQANIEIEKLKARLKVLESFDTSMITKAKEQATADFIKSLKIVIDSPEMDRKRTEEVYLFLDLIKKLVETK
jgi:hypothetical protein